MDGVHVVRGWHVTSKSGAILHVDLCMCPKPWDGDGGRLVSDRKSSSISALLW